MKAKDQIVPEQRTGKAIDAHAVLTLRSVDEAIAFFQVVRSRLQKINEWHHIADGISAEFRLTNSTGEFIDRVPQKGDYFRIDIPGPGTKAGGGYDWVQIEEIMDKKSEEEDIYGLRVRPASSPVDPGEDTAHFYSEESTSTFVVSRKGMEVRAEIFDRNTKPNDEAGTTVDMIRDAVVGHAGVLGFSKVQWKGLTEGLIGNVSDHIASSKEHPDRQGYHGTDKEEKLNPEE